MHKALTAFCSPLRPFPAAHLSNSAALPSVCTTPQAKGIPTRSQLNTSNPVCPPPLERPSLAPVIVCPPTLDARPPEMTRSPLGPAHPQGVPGRFGGQLVRAHVMALVHRPDREVAEEPDHEQPGHQVHGEVVGVRAGDPVVPLVLADVVD